MTNRSESRAKGPTRDFVGTGLQSTASAVSANGLYVVGELPLEQNINLYPREAFLWSENAGFVSLGDFPGGQTASNAQDVSNDGTVVGGSEGAPSLFNWGDGLEAFIWDSANGMRKLEDVLTDLGLDLSGWTLRYATSISADGLTVAGYGTNQLGNTEAWIATIPEPNTALLVCLGLVGMSASRRRR